MDTPFDIQILRQHWIKDDGKDDITDLCSHGEVYVRIGSEELSSKASGSWTLSSTALYLMRTMFDNYEYGKYASQLIPCCGHLFLADESGEFAIMPGCPNGIDWTIQHLENDQIKHISNSGEEGIINIGDYRKLVLNFVHQVERFYQENQPKKIPLDESDRRGYEAFWMEWATLTKKIQS